MLTNQNFFLISPLAWVGIARVNQLHPSSLERQEGEEEGGIRPHLNFGRNSESFFLRKTSPKATPSMHKGGSIPQIYRVNVSFFHSTPRLKSGYFQTNVQDGRGAVPNVYGNIDPPSKDSKKRTCKELNHSAHGFQVVTS
jgi:hypothetical protein